MKIKFNKNIYSQSAIKQAVSDFSELADINLNEKKEYFLVSFEDVDSEIDNIEDEFSNYVLSLMQ